MNNRFSINTNGFWETEDGIGHHYDNKVVSYDFLAVYKHNNDI